MNRARGFTLLEVMLAFVLLATAMGLLIAMLSNGLHQVSQAQSETEASLHAQSLLDQVGVLEPIAAGTDAGEFDQGRYRYQLEVREVPDPALPAEAETRPAAVALAAPRLYRVALAVSWGAGEPRQQLHFVTLRARTPAANTGLPP
jgi:general secretion pathway protein I